ncbi:MAG: 50S ribosomal protein L18 [Lentisphaerae bacterium RIFOXYB12_FULL_65_16]|nr:MAG: 50S ribosomal protein L18 [Lentisphaerae bacterium RIFOXYA12_64_32]OGV90148.1 MAG: 50S ribosomal protein L18 [Lentisphaerae bacterium RIFOXYB12_FULL_65_16]
MATLTKKEARHRRHRRLRAKISGTAEVPRMSVCRSANHMYVQFIDDVRQATLVSASTLTAAFKGTGKKVNLEGASVLGQMAAERAQAASIKRVVFDRGGFKYQGCVKALAEAARKAGLEF